MLRDESLSGSKDNDGYLYCISTSEDLLENTKVYYNRFAEEAQGENK